MTPPVNPQQMDSAGAAIFWRGFANQLGAEALLACYGWKIPPEALRPGETFWIYRGLVPLPSWKDHSVIAPDVAVVGWGSLIKDPTTPTYWHTSGVFPAFARQGYRQAIRQHTCGEAFARGAEAVSLVVLDTNPEHLCRCHREDEAGSPWKFSGRSHRPAPGQTIFTLLREDYVKGGEAHHVPEMRELRSGSEPLVHAAVSTPAGVVTSAAPADDLPSLLAREKVCCCFHLGMPDSEPACGQSG